MGESEDDLIHPNSILRIKSESGSEEVHYPLFHENLPDEYKLVAEQTLGETAANKEKGLRRLKEFMKKENLVATEDVLITVLRSCKYDINKSESKLKSFLRSRQSIIEKLCRVDEEKIKLILEDTTFSILPYRDKHGSAVFLTKPTVRLDLYSMSDVEPVAMSIVLYLLTFPMTTVCGINYLGECKCDTIHILYPIIKSFRPYVYYSMDLPVRIRRADLVNENVLVRFFYNVIRPILPKKMTKRICFHGNSYESLHSAYHPAILPKDLEGHLEPISDQFYRGRLLKFIQALKEEG